MSSPLDKFVLEMDDREHGLLKLLLQTEMHECCKVVESALANNMRLALHSAKEEYRQAHRLFVKLELLKSTPGSS